MEDANKARLELRRALLSAHIAMQLAEIQVIERLHRRSHDRRARRYWTRPWLSVDRKRAFGFYDQLMMEMKRKDSKAFTNFMRMQPDMFDEILQRVRPRITKQKHSSENL